LGSWFHKSLFINDKIELVKTIELPSPVNITALSIIGFGNVRIRLATFSFHDAFVVVRLPVTPANVSDIEGTAHLTI